MSKTDKQIKGERYENFAREILLMKEVEWNYNDDFVTFNHIEKNSRITGESGTKHQIDIHLTSSKDNSLHLLCECKDHSSKAVKSYACSFVNVINDIKNNHPDWNIIPAFISNTGFTKGALMILNHYKIDTLNLENLLLNRTELKITEKFKILKRKISKIYLSDGTILDTNRYFINYYRGGTFSPSDLINFYEIYDKDNNLINDIWNYKGYFITGKRKICSSEPFDKYILSNDNLNRELIKFEGEIIGVEEYKGDTSSVILPNDFKGVLKINENIRYYFKKDNTIMKIEN